MVLITLDCTHQTFLKLSLVMNYAPIFDGGKDTKNNIKKKQHILEVKEDLYLFMLITSKAEIEGWAVTEIHA